jgi:SAM-dependent methyltransferase
MSVDSDYFNALYARNDDPWGIGKRWYEVRKRALILASLPRASFARVFEPGCGAGHLTMELAPRAKALVAMELVPGAADLVRARLAGHGHVEVTTGAVPDNWPTGEFDLMVFSEIGYYIDAQAWTQVAARAARSLSDDGVLLACHYRHPFLERAQTTEAVHGAFASRHELHAHAHHVEPDFVIDVWTRAPLARRDEEGRA